jgi:sugar lactone lactonase YvrE
MNPEKTMNQNVHSLPNSRRGFLKTLGASTLAAVAFPNIILSQDKAGVKNPVIGAGDHTYECIHDWGELPASIKYGNTHGVCVDSQGRIYIKHTVGKGSESEDAVVVFDDKGKFITSWGKQFKGGAHGLHLSKEGNEEFLYFCDTGRNLVTKTTLDGKEIFTLKCPQETGHYKSDKEYVPTNIAVAPNGDFYVSDGYGRNWIHQYNNKAEYIRSFGGTGKTNGRTICPHGIMVDNRDGKPLLLIADRSNHRLEYFTLDGQFVKTVADDLSSPCHFHTYKSDLLIPDLDSRVTIFDRNNKLIVHLGQGKGYAGVRDKDRSAFTPGQFVAPHSAYYDHEGNIFVVEWVEVGRVTKLRRV